MGDPRWGELVVDDMSIDLLPILAVLEEEDITVRKIRLITDDESALYQQFIDTFETVTIIECRLCRVHWDRS